MKSGISRYLPRRVYSNSFPSPILIGGFAFAYVLTVGLLIQLFILPSVLPNLHAGNGLLVGLDSGKYHSIGVQKAAEIATQGWSEFELKPSSYGVSGILSILYLAFGPRPFVFLVVNALTKAISAISLFLVVRHISSSPKVATISILPFVFFPSSLYWDTQILNEGFAIAGIFLLTASFAFFWRNIRQTPSKKQMLLWAGAAVLGIVFVYIVRSYFLIFLLPSTAILGFHSVINGSNKAISIAILSILIIQASVGVITKKDDIGSQYVSFEYQSELTEEHFFADESPSDISLTEPPAKLLNNLLNPIMASRAGYNTYFNASSAIDASLYFSNYVDVIKYLPRALQIALFSPFPTMWFSSGDDATSAVFRAVASFETIAYYFFFPFFLVALVNTKHCVVRYLGFSAVFSSTILALSISNLGALYRFRFPFHMIVLAIGIATFGQVLADRRR